MQCKEGERQAGDFDGCVAVLDGDHKCGPIGYVALINGRAQQLSLGVENAIDGYLYIECCGAGRGEVEPMFSGIFQGHCAQRKCRGGASR